MLFWQSPAHLKLILFSFVLFFLNLSLIYTNTEVRLGFNSFLLPINPVSVNCAICSLLTLLFRRVLLFLELDLLYQLGQNNSFLAPSELSVPYDVQSLYTFWSKCSAIPLLCSGYSIPLRSPFVPKFPPQPISVSTAVLSSSSSSFAVLQSNHPIAQQITPDRWLTVTKENTKISELKYEFQCFSNVSWLRFELFELFGRGKVCLT